MRSKGRCMLPRATLQFPTLLLLSALLLPRKILRLPVRECNWWQCGQVVCAVRRERAFQGIGGFQARTRPVIPTSPITFSHP